MTERPDPSGWLVKETLSYRVVREIYAGAMSEVYEAKRLGVNGFQKRVALKFINPKMAEHKELLGNFIGEAKLVADLIHPNIGQIYTLGHYEGRFFIAMEYIDGVTLEQFVLQHDDLNRAIPFETSVFLISRVLRGLAYAHSKLDPRGRPLGLVHRDVNPNNIMISFEGDVKVMDFGVAKAHRYMVDNEEKLIAGKLDYMSPEQIDFKRTDFRSDIYSVTIVLTELLTRRKLFAAQSATHTRRQIHSLRTEDLFAQYGKLFEDERLREIVARGLAKAPEDRWASTREMFIAMEKLIYSDGYGPTTERMAEYLKEIFPHRGTTTDLGHADPTVIVSTTEDSIVGPLHQPAPEGSKP